MKKDTAANTIDFPGKEKICSNCDHAAHLDYMADQLKNKINPAIEFISVSMMDATEELSVKYSHGAGYLLDLVAQQIYDILPKKEEVPS